MDVPSGMTYEDSSTWYYCISFGLLRVWFPDRYISIHSFYAWLFGSLASFSVYDFDLDFDLDFDFSLDS